MKNRLLAVCALVSAVASCGCNAAQTVRVPRPAGSTLAVEKAHPDPRAAVHSAPSPSVAVALATAARSHATATPTVDTIVRPPNAPPEIVGLQFPKTTVHVGETIDGSIQTTSNVASVEVRIGGYAIAVPKTGEGQFRLSYRVPWVPFFLRKRYDLQIIARNTAGVECRKVLWITVR